MAYPYPGRGGIKKNKNINIIGSWVPPYSTECGAFKYIRGPNLHHFVGWSAPPPFFKWGGMSPPYIKNGHFTLLYPILPHSTPTSKIVCLGEYFVKK